MDNTIKLAKILLVDDSLSDQKLIKQSFADQKIANTLYTENCAEDALEFLDACKNGDIENELPDLILLDLNMPGMGGKGFLKQIKMDEYLNAIPVVVLTTSDSEMDILESYKLHAAGYIKKPVDIMEFREILAGLQEYWFVICKQITKTTSTMGLR